MNLNLEKKLYKEGLPSLTGPLLASCKEGFEAFYFFVLFLLCSFPPKTSKNAFKKPHKNKLLGEFIFTIR